MKLYHLDFECGEYDSYYRKTLGTYSSDEKRREALVRFREKSIGGKKVYIEDELSGTSQDGRFIEWESTIDVDISKDTISVRVVVK